MKNSDVFSEALRNTKRNKARTSLTVIAVFIGAFTLSLTSSIGTGVSTYISDQIGQIGAEGVMSVTKPDPEAEAVDMSKPIPYKETSASAAEAQIAQATSGLGFSTGMLTPVDIEEISKISGVDRVEPTIIAQPKYVMGINEDKWTAQPNITSSVMTPDLTAGEEFTLDGVEPEVIIPPTFVEALGFDNDEAAVGEMMTIVVDDATRQEQTIEATIVGVNNKSLFGETVSFNVAASQAMIDSQKLGLPAGFAIEDNYISAIVHTSPDLTPEQIETLKADLDNAGFAGQTISDQLGSIQAVIDGIVGVLNGFAIIALIAAGFGIVNTLLMSVQERTREIGLMKAMGLSSSKVYALFSSEAVLIGLIGTVLGVGAAFLLGLGINEALATTLLADLPGLTISLFTFPDVATVFAIVMVISFLAGTIPSMKAAKQNPIDALRYE